MKNIFALVTLLFSTISLAAPGVSAKKLSSGVYGLCLSDGSNSSCPMQVTMGKSGSINIGRSDGVAPTQDVVGGVVSASSTSSFSQSVPVHAQWYDVAGVSVSVPPGSWTLCTNADVTITTNDAVTTRLTFAEYSIRVGSTVIQKVRGTPIAFGNSGNDQASYGHAYFCVPVNISATTIYKASVRSVNVTGSPTMLSVGVDGTSESPVSLIATRR